MNSNLDETFSNTGGNWISADKTLIERSDEVHTPWAGEALRTTVTANADRFAADLAPGIADIRSAGHVSLRAIAAELNARGHDDTPAWV